MQRRFYKQNNFTATNVIIAITVIMYLIQINTPNGGLFFGLNLYFLAYDFLLTSNLSSGDKKFDDLKFNAKKGLETLINTNMALSASDFAEELIFNPFLGAVTKKAFKAARTLKNIDKAVVRAEAIRNIGKEIPFTVAKKITESATAKQALKGVENFVDLTLTKLPAVSKVIDKAVKPAVSAVS